MSFGLNLQFLRKMHHGMTQENLAEKIGVSRQTISKWEMEAAFPEMEKAITICDLFNCSLDELLRGNINTDNSAYKNIRVETVKSFRYIKYAVISEEPIQVNQLNCKEEKEFLPCFEKEYCIDGVMYMDIFIAI